MTPARPVVISAVPTPFDDRERLAQDAFRALLARLDDVGIDAVFVAGTTGEFTALDDSERLETFRLAIAQFGPDRVFAHVGAPSAFQAERLTRQAREVGARRLAAVTPFFQPAPPEQIVEYYRRIVGAADGGEVYAYLFRLRTTTVAPPSLLGQLADVGVAGVKISGESDDAVQAYLDAAPGGFTVYSGNDTSLRWLMQQGGHGIVSGVSSAYPEPFIRLRDAIIACDESAIQSAERVVSRAVDAVRAGNVGHLKAAITVRGIPAGNVRTATEPVPAADQHELLELARRL